MKDVIKLLVFSLDNQLYGIPLDLVYKVLFAVEITPPSNSSPLLLGMVNVQGAMRPVMDIRGFMDLKSKELGLFDQFIVIELFSRTFIFVADSVFGIEECCLSKLEKISATLQINTGHVKGALVRDNLLICLLDFEKLILEVDAKSLTHLSSTRRSLS